MVWSRSRNYSRRWGRYGRYRRNMRGRARGNKKAANAQRDTATVVINSQKTYQIPLTAGNTSNAIAINMWYILRSDSMFSAYRGMYDQVKILSCHARIKGLNGSSALTLSNTPTICTAWDRNGLEDVESNEAIGDAVVPYLSYSTVASYSSSIVSNWSPGNAFKITRHIYPSTMSEKSYYVPCSALIVNNTYRNPTQTYVAQTGQDFKPILLIGAYTGFSTSAPQSIGFMIEFDIAVAFRGLRKFSVSPDAPDVQVATMAGTALNGQTGQTITPSNDANWTRQNNNGDIGKYTIDASAGTANNPSEIPTLPTGSGSTNPPMTNIIPLNRTLSGSTQQVLILNANDEGADGYNPINISTNILLPLATSTTPGNYTSNGNYSITTPEGYYGISRYDFVVNVPQSLPIYTLPSPVTYTSNGDFTISVPQGYSGISSPTIQVRVPQVYPEDQKIEVYSIADKNGSTVPLERMSVAPSQQNVSLSAYQVGVYLLYYPDSDNNPGPYFRLVWHWSSSANAFNVPRGAHWTRFSAGSNSNPPKAIIFYDILDRPLMSYGNMYEEGEANYDDYLDYEGHASFFSNLPIKFPWSE